MVIIFFFPFYVRRRLIDLFFCFAHGSQRQNDFRPIVLFHNEFFFFTRSFVFFYLKSAVVDPRKTLQFFLWLKCLSNLICVSTENQIVSKKFVYSSESFHEKVTESRERRKKSSFLKKKNYKITLHSVQPS